MKMLKVERMGTEVQGVRLKGDPRSPEPTHFRVQLPGGDVDIVRCDDGSYWVHVRVDGTEEERSLSVPVGGIIDARLDIRGKHASDVDVGDFADPKLYHVALRVAADPKDY